MWVGIQTDPAASLQIIGVWMLCAILNTSRGKCPDKSTGRNGGQKAFQKLKGKVFTSIHGQCVGLGTVAL